MDSLQATYRDEEDEEEESAPAIAVAASTSDAAVVGCGTDIESQDAVVGCESSLTGQTAKEESPALPDAVDGNNGLSNATTVTPGSGPGTNSKKSKKKSNNVWVTQSTRKGKKKSKTNNNNNPGEDTVLITPVPRFPDKSDDTSEMKLCLSKVYKAEKVELSEDRMSAGSTKGYRMVRATKGVVEGAWYFEIKVVKLGETGHTHLGWSTEKGDLQALVGYDGNSFGYRDIDGSKIHKALREKYGEEGYKEGDVIGFYINLPDGAMYAPKERHLVWYKGQRYVCGPDAKEDPPKVVPGKLLCDYGSSSKAYNNKVWLMGIASCQTYMRCQMRQPPLETHWALQAVPIPSSSALGLSLHASRLCNDFAVSLIQKPFNDKEEQDKLTCCVECASSYEKEAQLFKLGQKKLLPSWLQSHSTEDHHKDELTQLRRKWNRLCHCLHQSKHSKNHWNNTPCSNHSSNAKIYPYGSSYPWWLDQGSNSITTDSSSICFTGSITKPSYSSCNLEPRFRRQQSCTIEFNFGNETQKHKATFPYSAIVSIVILGFFCSFFCITPSSLQLWSGVCMLFIIA